MLGHVYGASGIAAGIALGAWSSAFTLIRGIAAGFGFSIDDAARRRLPRIVRGRAGDGRSCCGWQRGWCWRQTPTSMAWRRPRRCWLLIAGGIAIYGLLLALFGVTGWREALDAIRRTPAGRLARVKRAWQTTARNSGKLDHGDG